MSAGAERPRPRGPNRPWALLGKSRTELRRNNRAPVAYATPAPQVARGERAALGLWVEEVIAILIGQKGVSRYLLSGATRIIVKQVTHYANNE